MKKLVSLILALAVALSLTGAAFAEEPVTITYATFSASGAQEETLKKMVEVFEEKNPDIKVDVQLTGYDDYFTKLATTVGGGNAPERVRDEHGKLPGLHAARRVRGISPAWWTPPATARARCPP